MRDEHVYGSNRKWATILRIFWDADVTKKGKDGKTEDRGKVMIFVGYPFNWEVNVMRMWNPETNPVIVSQYIIFLNRMCYKRTDVEERLWLKDDKPQADDAVGDDEELADDNGNDTFSGDGDEDEFSDHESVVGDTITNNATVTWIGRTVK